MLYRTKSEEKHLPSMQGFVTVLKEKYFFDRFYDWLIIHVQENMARLTDAFDQVVIDRGGNQGLGSLTSFLGKAARRLQNGWIQSYALIFSIGFIALAIYLIFGGAKL
jgi:NADH-quinone oxidoreductase subunit L